MKNIYVFANGADFISINGVCYRKVNIKDRIDTDSADVIVHKTAEDCKKANS